MHCERRFQWYVFFIPINLSYKGGNKVIDVYGNFSVLRKALVPRNSYCLLLWVGVLGLVVFSHTVKVVGYAATF